MSGNQFNLKKILFIAILISVFVFLFWLSPLPLAKTISLSVIVLPFFLAGFLDKYSPFKRIGRRTLSDESDIKKRKELESELENELDRLESELEKDKI